MRRDEIWTNRDGEYVEPNSPDGFSVLIKGTDKYLNWNTVVGTSGYGLRDNSGRMEFKHSGEGWRELGSNMGEINYFNTTGTAISIASQSDGSTNMVVCNPVTTLNNDSGFDMPSNGRLRYTGATTKMFHVACTISFAAAEANDVFVIGIAKNGTLINSSKCIVRVVNTNDTASTALHVMAELATNQYLELYAGNTTDAGDFTIKTLTLFAMGM